MKPEWIVAFIIGSLLIYAIFRLSRRYTATFTNYTCPYCGSRLEYAYLRRLGRTYLYCPRCRRFFVNMRYNTAATFTQYVCPYCGRRLEYVFVRRRGRTYLYCPRCRRFFTPIRY